MKNNIEIETLENYMTTRDNKSFDEHCIRFGIIDSEKRYTNGYSESRKIYFKPVVIDNRTYKPWVVRIDGDIKEVGMTIEYNIEEN